MQEALASVSGKKGFNLWKIPPQNALSPLRCDEWKEFLIG